MTDIENAINCISQQVTALEQELSNLKTDAYIQAYKFEISNKKLAIQALTEKLHRLENPPLTVDYLKEINRDMNNRRWVWIEVLKPFDYKTKVSAYYQAQSDYTKGESFCCGYPGIGFGFDYCDYGRTWIAYCYDLESEDK